MPIKAVCPECQTAYQLADHQAGKNVRCKSCQTVFEADASSRRTAIRGDDGLPSAKGSKSTTMARRRDPDEEEADNPPPRAPARSVEKKNTAVWILGGAAVCFGLLLLPCMGLTIYLLMQQNKSPEVVNASAPAQPAPMAATQPKPPAQQLVNPPNVPPPWQPDSQPIEPTKPSPVEPTKPVPAAAKPAEPPPQARSEVERPSEEKGTNDGRISAATSERVKRATVYLRVKMPEGDMASGSGFFGCKEAKNIVLTNAHVVGMLSPESPPPQSVEVVVNSGEGSEWKTTARVLGVDRRSDLAVLDIGTPSQAVPEPLTVKSAGGLHELDDLYVFGFPHGEGLGKEISMRKSSVSALRKKNGVLETVQVEGGMGPGNSGGPVVDKSGAVVGVAVAGIRGEQINFAIPGERVHGILDGCMSALAVGQSYFLRDNKVAVPVAMDMIDPRNLIKEVGVDVWVGDKPADAKSGNRPPATKQPAAQRGDSEHKYHKMTYRAPEGRSEIVLPELPAGKVYWKQPRWINGKGETHWGSADPMPVSSQPVHRTPANLVLHHTTGTKRALDLRIENIFRVSSNEDSEAFRTRLVAQLSETVLSTGASGSQLNLRYKFPPSWDRVTRSGRTVPNGELEQYKDQLPRLISSVVQIDRLGNITRQEIDPNPLRQLGRANQKQLVAMKQFHEKIQHGLEALSLSLKPGGSVQPMESWKTERPVLIDTILRAELGKMDVTFTYLGTRKRNGREEAVISVDGLVHGKVNGLGGRADGQVLVDLTSGQTILAELSVKLQLKALVSISGEEEPRELRLLATMKLHLERKRDF